VPNRWFETVAHAQAAARRRLPSSVYSALVAGTERGVTASDNVAAFDEIRLTPRIAATKPQRNLATTVMGQELSMPVLISPTGVQAVHPEGELPMARAARSRGTAMGLSSFASRPVEEVTAACDKVLFQVYWIGTRDEMAQRMARARQAGAVGLILTLDWSFSHGRDWGSPLIPEKVDLKSVLRFAPQALTRPRWSLDHLKAHSFPDLTVPNMVPKGALAPTFFGAYGQWMGTTPPSWGDVAWMRAQWEGPFMVKGVLRVDDAKAAVDAGATAISVSNHGGNNLDSAPATIRALPGIAEAVGGQVEVLLDGGIRRGLDVVKALALGARAVMIGRASLWGLAANGQAGVENVLDVLRDGIDSTLRGLGKSSVAELSPADVSTPADFTEPRAPRAAGPVYPSQPQSLIRT
jgi:heme/flavin dehydrogenase (mycofactocin system)